LYSILLNTQLSKYYIVSDCPKHSIYRDTKYNFQLPVSCTFYAVYPLCCVSCMLCILYAVYPLCCVSCMLCILYAVYPVCCVSCMLCILYAVYPVCYVLFGPDVNYCGAGKNKNIFTRIISVWNCCSRFYRNTFSDFRYTVCRMQTPTCSVLTFIP